MAIECKVFTTRDNASPPKRELCLSVEDGERSYLYRTEAHALWQEVVATLVTEALDDLLHHGGAKGARN